jgi:hypothetical protein
VPRRPPPRGQATVELVALLPALALLALVCGWLVAGAYAWSLAGGAARAGARAAEVGAPAEAAVRAALPGGHARRARVTVDDGGRRVRVRLDVPRPLPFLPVARVTGEAEVAR